MFFPIPMAELKAGDYIQEWGGKIGGHLYLKDRGGFDAYLPDAAFLKPNEPIEAIKTWLSKYTRLMGTPNRQFSAPLIVRASHPNDFDGFVDVLHTEPNVKLQEKLEEIIENIRMQGKSKEVFRWSNWEGKPYDGHIRVMVAKQLTIRDSLYTHTCNSGSVVEHPHQRGTFIVDYIEPHLVGNEKEFHRMVVKNNEVLHYSSDGEWLNPDELPKRIFDILPEIVNLYALVRNSGLVPNTDSFQMEYGHSTTPEKDKHPLQFFQARLFKPFEEPQFDLPTMRGGLTLPYAVFGMTSPEGIILPSVNYQNTEETYLMRRKKPYALIMKPRSILTKGPRTSFYPINMHAFFANSSRSLNFEHNVYRFAKLAQLSVLDATKIGELQSSKKVRAISNGIDAIIEKIA